MSYDGISSNPREEGSASQYFVQKKVSPISWFHKSGLLFSSFVWLIPKCPLLSFLK